MSKIYQQFCIDLSTVSQPAKDWMQEIYPKFSMYSQNQDPDLREELLSHFDADDLDEIASTKSPGFSINEEAQDGHGALFLLASDGEPDTVAQFVYAALRHTGQADDFVLFSWVAFTLSSPSPHSNMGGAYFITKDDITSMSTAEWSREWIEKLRAEASGYGPRL